MTPHLSAKSLAGFDAPYSASALPPGPVYVLAGRTLLPLNHSQGNAAGRATRLCTRAAAP